MGLRDFTLFDIIERLCIFTGSVGVVADIELPCIRPAPDTRRARTSSLRDRWPSCSPSVDRGGQPAVGGRRTANWSVIANVRARKRKRAAGRPPSRPGSRWAPVVSGARGAAGCDADWWPRRHARAQPGRGLGARRW